MARDAAVDADPVPVFVIALERRPRAAALCGSLARMGIPFERVEATDVSDLSDEALAAVYDERAALRQVGRPLGRGEIGCALSHRAVYRTIVERNLPLALILEEDAIPGPQLKALWRQSRTLPPDIDVLVLYSKIGFVGRRASGFLGGCGLHEATSLLSGTVGYFVRHSCAAALHGEATRVGMVADWPIDLRRMRQFLALPLPVNHDDTTSTIASCRPRNNILNRFEAPRPLSALFHLTGFGYLLQPWRYQGPANYYRREVAPRLKRIFAPGEMHVASVTLAASDNEPD